MRWTIMTRVAAHKLARRQYASDACGDHIVALFGASTAPKWNRGIVPVEGGGLRRGNSSVQFVEAGASARDAALARSYWLKVPADPPDLRGEKKEVRDYHTLSLSVGVKFL